MSVEELTAVQAARLAVLAQERATQMVTRLDSDGDGQLSAAELAARPMPGLILSRIDTDSDGAVTQAELDAARAHRCRRTRSAAAGLASTTGMAGAMAAATGTVAAIWAVPTERAPAGSGRVWCGRGLVPPVSHRAGSGRTISLL